MSDNSNFYADYYTVLEKEKAGLKEVREAMRTGGWDGAIERLKQVLYEYGYSLSSGKEPNLTINEELLGKVGSKGFSNDALINTLMEMDNEYRATHSGIDLAVPTLPGSLGLEKKEYVKKSDEEILEEAESALLPALIKNKNSASEKLTSLTDKLEEERESATYSQVLEQNALKESGESALRDHQNDMIFQGLTHSTINSEGAKNIVSDLAFKSMKIDEKYDNKLTKIKNDLTLAEKEYQNAIREYDLEYAADLESKVNKLKLNEEKRLEEINAYNKKITEQEEKYKIERLETLEKLRAERQEALLQEMSRDQTYEKEFGISPEKQAEYAKRKDMALSFYSNFTKEETLALIASASVELKKLLGYGEYLRLLSWNNAR